MNEFSVCFVALIGLCGKGVCDRHGSKPEVSDIIFSKGPIGPLLCQSDFSLSINMSFECVFCSPSTQRFLSGRLSRDAI